MISARDVVTGIYAAWRLFLFDRSAVQYLDSTTGGFWRSFYAAAVVLPAVFIVQLLVIQDRPDLIAEASGSRVALVFALDYIYQWVLFPFIMFYIAELMGRDRQYISFVFARNWSHVIQVAIIFPATVVFFSAGGEASGFGALLLFAAYVITWIYAWFIARTVLDITGLAAAVIVLVEFAVSESISLMSRAMLMAG